MQIIEKLEKAQEQTWWLPQRAQIFEGTDHCYYKHGGKYFIVRFTPKPEDIGERLSQILQQADSEPVRFVYMPHRHSEAVLDAFKKAGFSKTHRYEARAVHVDSYNREPSQRIRASMVDTFEEMKALCEVRRRVFGSDTPEPEENVRRYLKDATSPEGRVRQFIAVDKESGELISQAGMSLFPRLGFSFLFAGGTLASARGKGAYTALVAARIAYARSIGIEHVGLFAREDTSSPILEKQGFGVYGEMEQWILN